MKAIEILIKEHNLISLVLPLIKKSAEDITMNKGPKQEFYKLLVDFTKDFTNGVHHYKEEIVMFGMLAQKLDGKLDAQIEKLRSQHSVLRDLATDISSSLDNYTKGHESAERQLHRASLDYASKLQEHIETENRVFYPVTVKVLNDTEKENLLAEFESYESKFEENSFTKNQARFQRMSELV